MRFRIAFALTLFLLPVTATEAKDVLKDAACSSSCSEVCCSCPSWTAGANYLYLWRETTGSNFPLIVDTGTGTPSYTESQIDFDGQSGFDAYVGWDN